MLWWVETGSGVCVCIAGWSNRRLEKEKWQIEIFNDSSSTTLSFHQLHAKEKSRQFDKKRLRCLIRREEFIVFTEFQIGEERNRKANWSRNIFLSYEPNRLTAIRRFLTIEFIDEVNRTLTSIVTINQWWKFVALIDVKLYFRSKEKRTKTFFFPLTPTINVDSLTKRMQRNGR